MPGYHYSDIMIIIKPPSKNVLNVDTENLYVYCKPENPLSLIINSGRNYVRLNHLEQITENDTKITIEDLQASID